MSFLDFVKNGSAATTTTNATKIPNYEDCVKPNETYCLHNYTKTKNSNGNYYMILNYSKDGIKDNAEAMFAHPCMFREVTAAFKHKSTALEENYKNAFVYFKYIGKTKKLLKYVIRCEKGEQCAPSFGLVDVGDSDSDSDEQPEYTKCSDSDD